MPRIVQWFFAGFIAALIVGGPLVYASHRKAHLRNFRSVHAGVLYRSGQLSLAGLKQIVGDHGIRTVITLRDAETRDSKAADWEEEKYCRDRGLNFHRLPPRNWSAPDGSVPAAPNVDRFLALLDDRANYPVLIHCFRGVHRTGAYCAIYRMEYERWERTAALAELEALGYRNLDEEWDIVDYLKQYQPRWQTPRADTHD